MSDLTYRPKIVDKMEIFKFTKRRNPYTGQDLNLKIFGADLLRGEKIKSNI